MSDYDINNNSILVKRIIENEKTGMQKYLKEYPESLIPLFEKELRELGYQFEVSSQIKGFLPKHKEIILPIVVRYYQQAKHENEKNHFLSFLHFKGFEEVIPMLLNDFYASDTSQLTREFIGDTLYEIRSKKYIDDYIKIISNREYGLSRSMVILLVGKLKVEKAISVLLKLLDDQEFGACALIALGDFKRKEFRSYFERFENDKRSDVRKYAKAALRKLEK